MKLFGRNKDRPLEGQLAPMGATAVLSSWEAGNAIPDKVLKEAQRVLKAVTYQDVGAEEHWAPFDSVFQEVAFNGSYPDIFEFLCKTNSKVVFDD